MRQKISFSISPAFPVASVIRYPNSMVGADMARKITRVMTGGTTTAAIIVTGSAVFDGKDPFGNAQHMITTVNEAVGK